jgi:polyhydroxyalkanoate synthesis regulator phasin
MVEKKKYYKQKLLEKKNEILKTLIEEELDFLIEDIESHGLARFTDRGSFTGMLLSPIADIKNAVLHGAAKGAVQVLGLAGLLIAGTISALLPFNDPRTVNFIAKKIQYWEQENLKNIDKQFEKELGQMKQGWETFKTDFWGIGFVASPISAIAALTTAEKGIDVGLSILNVITGGKVEAAIDRINGDIKDPGSFQSYTKSLNRIARDVEEEKEERNFKAYREFQKQQRQQNLSEVSNAKLQKTGIESLNELHQKINKWVAQGEVKPEQAKEFFGEMKNTMLKNPEVNQAAQKWSAVNISKMMTNIFTNVNNDIAAGRAGVVSPQEIQAYKANGPKMVSEIFKSLNKKSKKFKPVSTQAALKAAQQAVTASMAKMPNQSVAAQPQSVIPQVAATPQIQQPAPITKLS